MTGFKKSETNTNNKKEANYKIIDDLGTFGSARGYDRKLTFTSWNGNDAKYEFRSWKQEDGTPGREIHTFTGEEMEAIYGIMKKVMGDA